MHSGKSMEYGPVHSRYSLDMDILGLDLTAALFPMKPPLSFPSSMDR